MSIWGFDAPVLPVLRHCSTIHAECAVGRGAGSSCTDGRYRGLCVALGGEGAGIGPHCLRTPPDRGWVAPRSETRRHMGVGCHSCATAAPTAR